ncbi:MAG: ABC-type transport auxiliary lipoprotein family protein [Henriciella sp.]|uniref:ABC-type transport auxiliary lipoprotein family protein n=1 Tax=Henriciella sp. TaxID=1968823 RepID=UPI003C7074AB
MGARFKILLAAPLAAVLASCVSVLPEQPKPKALFDITAPAGTTDLSANVVIREPDAPRLFASRNITSVGPQGGFQLVPGISWVDRSTRLLQITMIDSFSTGGEGIAVDDGAGVSGDAELYWRVTQFSLDGNEGVCSLQLTLLDGRSREPIAQTTVSSRSASEGKGPQARAGALSAAARECVDNGARFVSDAVDRMVAAE